MSVLDDGYLRGGTVRHIPVADAPHSTVPGWGTVRRSLCGRYEGIVYASRIIPPEIPVCRFCERAAASASEDEA